MSQTLAKATFCSFQMWVKTEWTYWTRFGSGQIVVKLWSEKLPHHSKKFRKQRKNLENQWFSRFYMVEISGIEPLTS